MSIPFLIPPKVEIFQEPQVGGDLRLKNLVRPYQGQRAYMGLVGVPFDTAIVLGGGRAGSRGGPTAVREALKRYGVAYNLEKDIDLSDLQLVDFGDVEVVEEDVVETHRRVRAVVKKIHEIGVIPLTIGGGHDLAYPTGLALAAGVAGRVGGINVDAHLDVREVIEGRITSGTPFRRLLEESRGRVLPAAFVEVGAQGDVNARCHVDYLKERGSTIVPLEQVNAEGAGAVMIRALEIASRETEVLFFSLDIDAVAQAFAPGCSAPGPRGLTPQQVWEMAFLAGSHPQVRSMDLVEINPRYDVDGRTARLGISLILAFLCGLKTRIFGKRLKR